MEPWLWTYTCRLTPDLSISRIRPNLNTGKFAKIVKNRHIWLYTELLSHPITEKVCTRSWSVSALQYGIVNLSPIRIKFFTIWQKCGIIIIFVTLLSVQRCCFGANVYTASFADRVLMQSACRSVLAFRRHGVIRCTTLEKRPRKWVWSESCH